MTCCPCSTQTGSTPPVTWSGLELDNVAIVASTFTGGVVTGSAVTDLPAPTADDDAATKVYVDETGVLNITNIADLRAVRITSFASGRRAFVRGYYTAGDGGGGKFYYNLSSVLAENGGTVIRPNSGSGRWLREIDDLMVTPRFFGAVGDGIVQDQSAFQAAINWAEANAPTYNGSLGGTQPGWKIRVTKGKYLFGATVNLLQRTIIEGDGAILIGVDSTIDFFKCGAFEGTWISGFLFFGGQNQIKIETGNVSACRVDISNCIFDAPGTCAIATDDTSQSTTLNITGCLILTEGKRAVYSSCDFCSVRNCWITSTVIQTTSIILNKGGLVLDSVFFVPGVGSTYPRIENRGVSVKSSFCRYGGEGGGDETLHNYMPPNQAAGAASILDFQSNSMWGAGSKIIRLFEVPDSILVTDNELAVNETPVNVIVSGGYTKSAYFTLKKDEKVTFRCDIDGTADLSFFTDQIAHNNDSSGLDNVSGSSIAFGGFSLSTVNLGTGGSASGGFDDSANNPFFGKSTTKVITGSANSSGNVLRYGLNGPNVPGTPVGIYTFGFYIKSDKSIPLTINFGNGLPRNIQIPASDDYGAVWVTGQLNATRKGLEIQFIGLPLNATFYFTAPFVIKGTSAFPRPNMLYSTTGIKKNTLGLPAVTTPPSGVFAPFGDILFNSVPAVGSPVGWVNTTYGASPTYKPFGYAGMKGQCMVRLNGDQATTSALEAAINWDAEYYDDLNIWSIANPERLTVPTGANRVRLTAGVRWAANATGYRSVKIKSNNPATTYPLNSTWGSDQKPADAVAAVAGSCTVTTGIIAVADIAYFTVTAEQTSGGALNLIGTAGAFPSAGGGTFFQMEVIS